MRYLAGPSLGSLPTHLSCDRPAVNAMVYKLSALSVSSALLAGSLIALLPEGATSLRQQSRAAFVGFPQGCARAHPVTNRLVRPQQQRWSMTEERETEQAQQKDVQQVVGISEDDPIVQRLRENIKRETGVELDQLLNPSKVVNLEFDLINLRNELEVTSEDRSREKIEKLIAKKEATLATEKRLVMRGWLKQLFLGQSLLAVAISGFVAYDALPGFEHLPLPVRAFAFWSFWMFTIPSLRARKPGRVEKKALDIAFLVTPIVSLGMPFLTQDVPTIWWANALATGASYGYAFTSQEGESDDGEDETLPKPIRAALKALDWGSGRERGARQRVDGEEE